MYCPICKTQVALATAAIATCVHCDHFFQYPVEVGAQYNKQYVQSRYDAYPTTEAMSYLRLGVVRSFSSKGQLLDVGYGNGAFLKVAEKAGFTVFGNDVHKADYGIKEEDLVSAKSWEVITFFDSLEHFQSFEEIRDLARRAYWIILSIPRRPAWFPNKSPLHGVKDWKHYLPGEHLHYFSQQSITKLFDKHKIIRHLDIEDTIRGKLPDGSQNISTLVLCPQ